MNKMVGFGVSNQLSSCFMLQKVIRSLVETAKAVTVRAMEAHRYAVLGLFSVAAEGTRSKGSVITTQVLASLISGCSPSISTIL